MMQKWHGIFVGLTVMLLVGICLDTAQAQRRPRGGPGGRGGFGGMMAGGMFGASTELSLLRRSDVQQELELLDEQKKDLQKLSEDQRNALRDLFSQMRNMTREERSQKIRSEMQKIQSKVDEILLPHQSKRLKQLALQRRLRGGLMAILGDEQLTRELGISDSSKQQLETKARELEDQLRKQIAELRKQAQAKLMKNLSPAQQAKLKDLLGEPFEFKDEPPTRRGPSGR